MKVINDDNTEMNNKEYNVMKNWMKKYNKKKRNDEKNGKISNYPNFYYDEYSDILEILGVQKYGAMENVSWEILPDSGKKLIKKYINGNKNDKKNDKKNDFLYSMYIMEAKDAKDIGFLLDSVEDSKIILKFYKMKGQTMRMYESKRSVIDKIIGTEYDEIKEGSVVVIDGWFKDKFVSVKDWSFKYGIGVIAVTKKRNDEKKNKK